MMKSILITGARAPVALHFARLLTNAGHRVILADSQLFPMARGTKFKHKYFRLPKPVACLETFGRAVEAIVQAENCDVVLPTCEEIFYLAAWRDLHNGKIPLLAPEFSKLALVHNKADFARSTIGHAAASAETILIENKNDIADFAQDPEIYVFKPVWSRFASHILICPSRKEVSTLAPSIAAPWIAQKYLPGEELCSWAWVQHGEVKAFSAYRPLQRAGRGAAIAFEPVKAAEIESFVASYCKQLNWHGQIAFDFRRDADRHLHVLECNPRATSGAHFFGPHSNLAAALLEGATAKPDIDSPMGLPLAMLFYGLPQALKSGGPKSLSNWRREFAKLQDISTWPGDRPLWSMQLLSLLEIASSALLKNVALTTAATSDIAWNGAALGPNQ